ncbi:hypothetical protein AMS60_05685 [Bacillus sp. FJAT-21945]|nr:hypothetical protein AMS60_05685 [Bacillus sp. FJAT-21945]
MNFEIDNGVVYQIDEGNNYRSRIFHDYEYKLVTELEAKQVDTNVIVEGMVYKEKYDKSPIAITDNVQLTIGGNPLNIVELKPASNGLIVVNLVLENTTLENVPELSFSDGIVTIIWRYDK